MLKRILGAILVFWMFLVGLTFPVAPTFAVGNQGNQGMNRAATLIAPSDDFEINLYPKPDDKLKRLGYGLRGDEVTILEQMGVNKGYSWYRVKFENTSHVEGWIRGDNLAFINEDSNQTTLPSGDGYLGSQIRSTSQQKKQKQGNQYQQYNR